MEADETVSKGCVGGPALGAAEHRLGPAAGRGRFLWRPRFRDASGSVLLPLEYVGAMQRRVTLPGF